MLTEVAVVRSREVHLVVIRAHHRTVKLCRTVGDCPLQKVALGDERVVILAVNGRVKVLAATRAGLHIIDVVFRTELVGLVRVDALRVREAQVKTFQDFAPAEVVVNTGVDVQVRRHRTDVVTVVAKRAVRVNLVVVYLRVGDTVSHDGQSVDCLRDIAGTGQKDVVVLLARSSTYLNIRSVLLSIVARYVQVGREPLAYLNVNARTEVPTVVVEVAEVTVLVEV